MNEAINRANHRASVISSLDEKYSKTNISIDSTLTTTNKENNVGNSRSNAETTSVVSAIQNMFCDSSERTTNIFKDQLVGKSIIIENLKQQTEASKAVTKLKKELKRKKTISNTALKKIRKENMPISNIALLSELLILNSLWNQYIISVIKFSKSDAQLQARIVSAELVGAKCILVDASPPYLLNVEGIIVYESQHCYFIAITSNDIKKGNKHKNKRRRRGRKGKSNAALSYRNLLTNNKNKEDGDEEYTENITDKVINNASNKNNSSSDDSLEVNQNRHVIQIIKSKNTLAIELPYIFNAKEANPKTFTNDNSDITSGKEQSRQQYGNVCIVGYKDRQFLPEKINKIS